MKKGFFLLIGYYCKQIDYPISAYCLYVIFLKYYAECEIKSIIIWLACVGVLYFRFFS